MAAFADRQPATFETGPDTVRFRSSSTGLPTQVSLDWDGGIFAAVGVRSNADPEGAAVLISLDDVERLQQACSVVLQRAQEVG